MLMVPMSVFHDYIIDESSQTARISVATNY